jgi:tetratricopeptide (TPR) repeat protein
MTPTPSRPLAQIVRWLLTLTLLITPFVFTWVNEELFEFPKMLAVYGLMTLALTAAAIDQLQQKTIRLPHTVFDKTVGFFVVSQILATLLSIHPRTSWLGYYTRFNGGLLSTLTYVSFYYLVVWYFSPKQLFRLIQATLLAGALAALYAWPEHFGHSPSCLLITKTFNASCWIQDVKNRVFGTFGQPNWLAAYCITLLPLVLAWLSQVKLRWQQWGVGLVWILFVSVLIFTKSRSGLLGFGLSFAAGTAVLGYLAWQQQQLSELKQKLGLLVSVVLVSVFLVALYGTPFTPSLSSLLPQKTLQNPMAATPGPTGGTSLDTGGTESGQIRKIVWSGALAVWQRYPIFGSGVETFAYSYYQDRPLAHNQVSEWDFLYNKAHNEVLNYLATTGLVGTTAYLVLWGMMLWVSFKLVRDRNQSALVRVFSLAWAVGLTAQFISNFFGFSTVMINVLFWLGLACLAKWSNPSAESETTEIAALTGWRLALTLVALALGVWGVTRVTSWWTADRDYAASKATLNAGNIKMGMSKLEKAISAVPDEALFWDEIANQYSRLALALHTSPDASSTAEVAKELATAAIAASDQTLALNDRHLDFHKTRARIFINLGQIDPQYFTRAAEALRKASSLSPTDPKLYYNLGLVEITAHATSSGFTDLKKAIDLKPDYLQAWFDLGKAYEQTGNKAEAIKTYRYILDTLAPNNPEISARLKALQVLQTGP